MQLEKAKEILQNVTIVGIQSEAQKNIKIDEVNEAIQELLKAINN